MLSDRTELIEPEQLSTLAQHAAGKSFSICIILFCIFFSVLIFQEGAYAETAEIRDYQSLSLEDCLALAGKYNPALSSARERIQELVADYQAAKSQFFPQLSLLSYYERLEPNRLPPGGSTTPPTRDFNKDEGFAGIAGKQILFNGPGPITAPNPPKSARKPRSRKSCGPGMKWRLRLHRPFTVWLKQKKILR